jgi:hypothetical protein
LPRSRFSARLTGRDVNYFTADTIGHGEAVVAWIEEFIRLAKESSDETQVAV